MIMPYHIKLDQAEEKSTEEAKQLEQQEVNWSCLL